MLHSRLVAMINVHEVIPYYVPSPFIESLAGMCIADATESIHLHLDRHEMSNPNMVSKRKLVDETVLEHCMNSSKRQKETSQSTDSQIVAETILYPSDVIIPSTQEDSFDPRNAIQVSTQP